MQATESPETAPTRRVEPTTTQAVAQRLLATVGVGGPVVVEQVRTSNHVWRLRVPDRAFYLKVHTKDWYAHDTAAPARAVAHEAAAYRVLAAHGLAAPEVLAAEQGADNPLGHPFLLMSGLPGAPLTRWLAAEARRAAAPALVAVGDYLRRAHSIKFRVPGYIYSLDGPRAAPRPGQWQHPCWSAAARQERALAALEHQRAALPPSLFQEVHGRLVTIAVAFRRAYTPPRFVHGDCHAHQFFLSPPDERGHRWTVHGVVDMEVASAGDPGEDLMKFAIEAAVLLPVESEWWAPLFAGYGAAPDFELFRLRLLAIGPASFAWLRSPPQRPSWEHVLRHLLAARNWRELFSGGW